MKTKLTMVWVIMSILFVAACSSDKNEVAPEEDDTSLKEIPKEALPIIFDQKYSPQVTKEMENSSEQGAILSGLFVLRFQLYQLQSTFFTPPEGVVKTDPLGNNPTGFSAFSTLAEKDSEFGRFVYQFKETSDAWLYEVYIDRPGTSGESNKPDIEQFITSKTLKDQKSGEFSILETTDGIEKTVYDFTWKIEGDFVEHLYKSTEDNNQTIDYFKQNCLTKAAEGNLKRNNLLIQEVKWDENGTGYTKLYNDQGVFQNEFKF